MLYRRNGCHELLLRDEHAHRLLGDAANASTAYAESRAAFASQENPAGVSRAFTRLAEMQRVGGNYRQVESLARLALEFAPTDNHAARAAAADSSLPGFAVRPGRAPLRT